ncbi:hypothetical protein PS15m_000572 [Mucor circinelloides]
MPETIAWFSAIISSDGQTLPPFRRGYKSDNTSYLPPTFLYAGLAMQKSWRIIEPSACPQRCDLSQF